ncbi:MAG: Primosomal protein N' [Lentisphaerae bacterium ADurb.BinA184]|nr:MAG: Primosomal protein N' [Lentisphaerae bacterium ADurb.BinA184]
MASSVARVVVNLSLDRAFDYRIPESLAGRVRVGARVRIPFGKAGGVRVGYVVGLSDHSAFPDLKEIVGVEGEREQITPSLVRLAEWIAQYYCCSKEQAVRAMLPAVVRQGKIGRKKQQTVRLAEGGNLAEAFPRLEKRAPKQAAALRLIVREHQVSLARLTRESGAGPDAVRRLVAQGLVEIEGQVVDRDPFADEEILPSQALALTPDQAAALSQIGDSMDRRDAGVILLHGVTGSGKTEVYLQAIARCLELGREAIVLVPEIALTPQTTERFRARFGNTVSVMHSALSDGERLDEWTRVREGRSRIAVGARSALFAPFTNLGLIVVDEEHETTYKQSESPRYNARDVAVVRGKFERATVVLGSATPALESYHNCQTGKYLLAELPTRIDGRLMPVMEVVDMRAEAALRGGAQIFSRRLESLIRDRLDHGSQTILFLNRRGYATQMICQKCGYVATCGQCSVTYTYHRHDGRLLCHLCGEVRPAPTACPQCGDADIRFSGLGTEKVEAITRRLFPHAAIARMDSDTMTARHAYRKTLNAFRTGRVHILIGTQMIAKGLDFPNVTLVGIIYADQALHINDFRAGERTFQLLTQVSGRAGRGDLPGHVVVQSYTPFHSALQHAVEHDYRSFAEEELEARRRSSSRRSPICAWCSSAARTWPPWTRRPSSSPPPSNPSFRPAARSSAPCPRPCTVSAASSGTRCCCAAATSST